MEQKMKPKHPLNNLASAMKQNSIHKTIQLSIITAIIIAGITGDTVMEKMNTVDGFTGMVSDRKVLGVVVEV